MMARRDDAPATKADISELKALVQGLRGNMTTKDDLVGMATKDDLAAMATKYNLAAMATKNDISRLAKQIVINHAAANNRMDGIVQAVRHSQSTILNHMDGFMTQTRKVSVDQTFLMHRVDKLEKRVGSLEARNP